METGERVKAKSRKIKFEVVLVGPAVKDLATDKKLEPFVDRVKKAGVKIVVCENSMAHLVVKKSADAPSILTTPHGFTYLLGLYNYRKTNLKQSNYNLNNGQLHKQIYVRRNY